MTRQCLECDCDLYRDNTASPDSELCLLCLREIMRQNECEEEFNRRHSIYE